MLLLKGGSVFGVCVPCRGGPISKVRRNARTRGPEARRKGMADHAGGSLDVREGEGGGASVHKRGRQPGPDQRDER